MPAAPRTRRLTSGLGPEPAAAGGAAVTQEGGSPGQPSRIPPPNPPHKRELSHGDSAKEHKLYSRALNRRVYVFPPSNALPA